MKTKQFKFTYSNIESFENLTIHVDSDTIADFIIKSCAVKEQILHEIVLSNRDRTFKLKVNLLEEIYSKYQRTNNRYELVLSNKAYGFLLHFLITAYIQGYQTVNHIHIDFSSEGSPDFTVTVLITDENMVRWKYDNNLNSQ